jgi:hypothetical protein
VITVAGDSRRISLIAGARYQYEAEDDVIGFGYYASKDPSGAKVKITKSSINNDYVNTTNLPSYYFPYLKDVTNEIRSY